MLKMCRGAGCQNLDTFKTKCIAKSPKIAFNIEKAAPSTRCRPINPTHSRGSDPNIDTHTPGLALYFFCGRVCRSFKVTRGVPRGAFAPGSHAPAISAEIATLTVSPPASRARPPSPAPLPFAAPRVSPPAPPVPPPCLPSFLPPSSAPEKHACDPATPAMHLPGILPFPNTSAISGVSFQTTFSVTALSFQGVEFRILPKPSLA